MREIPFERSLPCAADRSHTRTGLRRAMAVAAVACSLVALAACADDSSNASGSTGSTSSAPTGKDLLGPTDVAKGTPVKIGQLTEGETPTVDASDEIPSGAATAEWLNQHRGGIGGHPIEMVTCEMKTDPAVAADCANKMVQEGVIAVALPQSAYAEAVWKPLHDAGIPLVSINAFGKEMETDATSTFITANPSATFFGLPISLAKSTGAKKVAFVVIDVPQAIEIVDADHGRTMAKAGLDYDIVKVPLGTPDMVPQMQQVASSGAGVVHILGNDSFCIAALKGLKAVGYTGAISAVSYCFTDATRAALGADLKGINVLSLFADGALDDPTYQQYLQVMQAYGHGIKEVSGPYALSGYAVVATVGAMLHQLKGDPTASTAAETIRSMPETDLPAGGGVKIKCGGSAVPDKPAICTNQWLRAQLDAKGEPGDYTVEDSSDVLG